MTDKEKAIQDTAAQKNEDFEYVVDDSVCSAEFPAGCTPTVEEQAE